MAQARFSRRFAIKLKQKKRNLKVYKRSASGRVSGGPDLAATAAYTTLFCKAVLACWEEALHKNHLPELLYETLEDFLVSAGFLEARAVVTMHDASATPPVPPLRRMTKLVQRFCFRVCNISKV